MSARRRFHSLRRRVETKAPRPKIVIFSEGKKTEPDYFNEMGREFRSVVVDVEVVEGAGAPLTIAKSATDAARLSRQRNRRQSYARADEFWAVFDRDDHPNIPEAIARCKAGDVGVAFSNPCFELWLILHFQDYDRPDHRHDVQKNLESICSDYDRAKRKTTDCDVLPRNSASLR